MTFDTSKRKIEKLYNIVKSNEYTINGLHKDEIQFTSRAFQKKHIIIPLEFTKHPIQPSSQSQRVQLYTEYTFANLPESIIPFISISLITEKNPAWRITDPTMLNLETPSSPIPVFAQSFWHVWKVNNKIDSFGNTVGQATTLQIYLIHFKNQEGGKFEFNLSLNFLNELTYNEIPNHKT